MKLSSIITIIRGLTGVGEGLLEAMSEVTLSWAQLGLDKTAHRGEVRKWEVIED